MTEEFGRVVVLVGPPGVGKGTQGRMLVERGGLPAVLGVSSSNIREYKRRKNLRESTGDSVVEKAALDLDEIANAANWDFIRSVPHGTHVILDGYPRTAEQCEKLGWYLLADHKPRASYVIFEASDEVCEARRQKRVAEALVAGNPPRPDDDKDTHEERLRVYTQNMGGILRFVHDNNYYRVHIDASETEEKVFHSVLNKLNWRVK